MVLTFLCINEFKMMNMNDMINIRRFINLHLSLTQTLHYKFRLIKLLRKEFLPDEMDFDETIL